MDVWNHYLEDFSRAILEDDYNTTSDSDYCKIIPESVLQVLPLQLQDLELESLQQYLEACGPLAQNLQQRKLLRVSQQQQVAASVATIGTSGTTNGAQDGLVLAAKNDTTTSSGSGKKKDAAVIMNEISATDDEHDDDEIPAIFWQTDFDLTDPDTFCQLLLQQQPADSNNNNNGNGNSDISVQQWFPLVAPDAFGGHLDKVELALLHQVRSQSGAFFEESLRFAQLQEWIEALLQQVTRVEATTAVLLKDLWQPVHTIPVCDEQRADLRRLLVVLDKTDDMLRCKSSIAGFLSAQDDLTAIEQIQYGRTLLAGSAAVVSTSNDELNATTGSSTGSTDDDDGALTQETASQDEVAAIELHRLQALRTVSEQLNQYEQLVVTNLREELVEVFLEWNTAAVSSIYAMSSNGHAVTPSNRSAHVKQRVCEIVGALQKCHGLEPARQAYGNRLQDTIRMTVRTTVGEFASDANGTESSGGPTVSIAVGATAMTLERFLDCLDMLFEQLLALLTSASGVDELCVAQGFLFQDKDASGTAASDGQEIQRTTASTDATAATTSTPMAAVVAAAAELSSKSISELLRLRKDAHSLVTLEEMKRIWDNCVTFTQQIEELGGHKAIALRSTLLAQAKAFVERKHESNMSALVAALDSERWIQCEVSAERQTALTRLCSGRAVLSSPRAQDASAAGTEKRPDAEVEGIRYKTVWSCLLVLEMVMNNVAAAAHFQSLASNVVSKISELLRLFNSRTTHLVLGAGAIHSAARLASINAKHLSLVTQCLGMVIATLPHVRAALMAQMPPRQHTLLSSLDQIKKEFGDHNEKVLNKFVTIIGGIVEHGLSPKIAGTNFDARAQTIPPVDGVVPCCVFVEGVSTTTRKMHKVLASLLPPDHLQDVFSRIFAFVDQKIPSLFVAAADGTLPTKNSPKKGVSPKNAGTTVAMPTFAFPQTDKGKERMLIEVGIMTEQLNGLDGVQPWDFTVVNVLERKLEYRLHANDTPAVEHETQVIPPAVVDTETSNAAENDTTEEPAAEENGKGTQADTVTVETAIDNAGENTTVSPTETHNASGAEDSTGIANENQDDTKAVGVVESANENEPGGATETQGASETVVAVETASEVQDDTVTSSPDDVAEHDEASSTEPSTKDGDASETGTEVTTDTGVTAEPESGSPRAERTATGSAHDEAGADDDSPQEASASAVLQNGSCAAVSTDKVEVEPVSTGAKGDGGDDDDTAPAVDDAGSIPSEVTPL